MKNCLLFLQVVFIILIKMRSWWESCCCLTIQSCPTLWNPMNYRPPGSSIHRILQARILEWVTIPFSRASSQTRDRTGVPTLQGDSLLLSHWGINIIHFALLLVKFHSVQFSSLQFSHSVMSDSLWPHELQHARPPCPSPSLGVHANSHPSSQWCHPAISSSVVPFSSCPQSLPASKSFPMSQLFVWGGQSIGVSALASFLPKKSQGWSPSEWTGWISLQSKGLSRTFSNTTVQKHQFFGTQLSSQSNSHIHTWPLEKP